VAKGSKFPRLDEAGTPLQVDALKSSSEVVFSAMAVGVAAALLTVYSFRQTVFY
jgi:hypothetical protein